MNTWSLTWNFSRKVDGEPPLRISCSTFPQVPRERRLQFKILEGHPSSFCDLGFTNFLKSSGRRTTFTQQVILCISSYIAIDLTWRSNVCSFIAYVLGCNLVDSLLSSWKSTWDKILQGKNHNCCVIFLQLILAWPK
jgi:hypothetical protein